jgi:LPS O-antigen subunit length determinant protein (WzzB/FepE family)
MRTDWSERRALRGPQVHQLPGVLQNRLRELRALPHPRRQGGRRAGADREER